MRHSVQELKLKNGARGLIVQVPDAQVVYSEISFRAGDFLADPKKWEVPHLMEHILLGANKQYPKARLFQAEIEKNGAYTNASTGAYDITYLAECAGFEWQRVLELMVLAISKPLFLESEFKAEYGNVREELVSDTNNYFRHLGLTMREACGYVARTDKERLKLMKNIELSDVKKHYQRTHTTSNMRFVVGGNFTPVRLKQLKDLLENIELPRGQRFNLPEEKLIGVNEPIQVRNRTVSNLYIYIDTFLSRRLNEPEEDSLSLANTLLTETLYSKILGAARERGLIYDMGSGISLPQNSTNWWFGAQVSLTNAKPFLEIVVTELEKVVAGKLPAADIEAAKQYSLGRFQRSAQTVGGTVSGYSSRYFFDGVIDDYYRVPDRIKSVTKSAIVDVASEMFKEKMWAFGALGSAPKELINELYEQLAVLWY